MTKARDIADRKLDGENLEFGDNDKAIFGAGSDLQIYHDGANSYVQDAGTGNLILSGSSQVTIGTVGVSTSAVFKTSAESVLYHNNAAKFATTSTGIDVTGTVVSDGLTVNSGASDLSATFQSTDPNVAINLTDSTTTVQLGNNAGVFQIYGDTVTYPKQISAGGGSVVINEDGYNIDFRVESDSNTHMLFVDAGNDTVCIGTSTAIDGAALSVNGQWHITSIGSALPNFQRCATFYYNNNSVADDNSIIYLVNTAGYQYHASKIDIVVTNGDSIESTASLWVDARETTVTSSNLGGINSTNIVAVNGTTGTDGKFNICANAQNGSSYLGLRNRMGGARRVYVQVTMISTR